MRNIKEFFSGRTSMSAPQPPGISILEMTQFRNATSQNGRLLYEYDTDESLVEEAAKTVDMSLVKAPSTYGPSRVGIDINVGAWKEMNSNFPDVLNTLGWINLNYFGSEPPAEVSIRDFWNLSRMAEAIPAYFFYRGNDSVKKQGELPNAFADVFKAGRGMVIAAHRYILLDQPLDTIVTAEQIYSFSHEKSLLVSEDPLRACAAPPTKFIDALRAIMYREKAEPIELLNPSEALGLYNFSEYYSFAASSIGRFFEKLVDLSIEINKGLSSDELQIRKRRFKDDERELLRKLRKCQVEANKALGRNPKKTPQPTWEHLLSQQISDPIRDYWINLLRS